MNCRRRRWRWEGFRDSRRGRRKRRTNSRSMRSTRSIKDRRGGRWSNERGVVIKRSRSMRKRVRIMGRRRR